MSEYIVEPVSRQNLRDYAYQIRENLKCENDLYFPIVEFWEALPEIFVDYTFEIIDDNEVPFNVHGYTDVSNKKVCIKNSVYEGADAGNGRDRMTMAHEISHFLMLGISEYRFERNFSGRPVYAFEDPEWQAKCMAGELLVPHHLISGMTPNEISKLCGVSVAAAKEQLKHI